MQGAADRQLWAIAQKRIAERQAQEAEREEAERSRSNKSVGESKKRKAPLYLKF